MPARSGLQEVHYTTRRYGGLRKRATKMFQWLATVAECNPKIIDTYGDLILFVIGWSLVAFFAGRASKDFWK